LRGIRVGVVKYYYVVYIRTACVLILYYQIPVLVLLCVLQRSVVGRVVDTVYVSLFSHSYYQIRVLVLLYVCP
jgi:hypothetical protein